MVSTIIAILLLVPLTKTSPCLCGLVAGAIYDVASSRLLVEKGHNPPILMMLGTVLGHVLMDRVGTTLIKRV